MSSNQVAAPFAARIQELAAAVDDLARCRPIGGSRLDLNRAGRWLAVAAQSVEREDAGPENRAPEGGGAAIENRPPEGLGCALGTPWGQHK